LFRTAINFLSKTHRLTTSLTLGFAAVAVAAPITIVQTSNFLTQIALTAALLCPLLLIILGVRPLAMSLLCIAFALEPLKAIRVTPSLAYGDVALVLAVGLGALVSGWVYRRISLPTAFVAGCAILALGGLVSSFLSSDLVSLMNLARLIITAIALPFLAAVWQPTMAQVRLLAGSYLVGQSASVLYGIMTPVSRYINRAEGLSDHPNHFGLASGLAVGLAVFLFLSGSGWIRWFALTTGTLCGFGVFSSGSRAALLAVLAMAVAVALIRRAWKTSVIGMIAIGLAVLAQERLLALIPSGSALYRLLGEDAATDANAARVQALTVNFDAFLANPLFGRGFANSLEAHNIFLQLAVSSGVIGLAGFVCILYAAIRPLWRTEIGVARWLALPPLGYLVAGMVSPVLWDRYVWLLIGLSLLVLRHCEDPMRVASENPGRERPQAGRARALTSNVHREDSMVSTLPSSSTSLRPST